MINHFFKIPPLWGAGGQRGGFAALPASISFFHSFTLSFFHSFTFPLFLRSVSVSLFVILCSLNFAFAGNGLSDDPDPGPNGVDTKLIKALMNAHPEMFADIMKMAVQREVQIIYTQINRDKDNKPTLTKYSFRLDPTQYFYPASTVKLATLATALEKINRMGIPGFTKYSRMEIDSAYDCQTPVKYDSTSETKYASLANYIKKILLISNNDAYNRVYEFCGQEYLNKRLWELGYPTIRILTRFFSTCDTLSNRYTPPMRFFDGKGKIVYQQPMAYNPVQFKNPLGVVKKGLGYMDGWGRIIKQPKDWTYGNYFCLEDIHDILVSLIFPQCVPKEKRFLLTDDDFKFIHKYMSLYPRECEFPQYCPEDGYIDSWKKYLFYGTMKNYIDNDKMRIFNIVGQAWGYLTDVAYICDFESKTEFFLAATIYTNNKPILDGKYENEKVGFPFLANLGQLIYLYEKNRKKAFLPNLDEFKVQGNN